MDTEVFTSANTVGGTFSPIVTSFIVAPSVVRVGSLATFTISAVDPIPGTVPAGYSLAVEGDGDYPTGITCDAGTSCSRTYEVAVTDSGSLKYTFTVQDADVSDSATVVSGNFRVDDTAAVSFGVDTYYIPEFTGLALDGSGTTQSLGVGTKTITLTLVDPDITIHADTITLAIGSAMVSEITGDLDSVGCEDGDITITDVATVSNTKTYTLTLDPQRPNAAATYGEIVCRYSFDATDSKGVSRLVGGLVVVGHCNLLKVPPTIA